MSPTGTRVQRAPARRRPDAGPMHASISFGRVAGVEIGANWTWLLVFGLIVWSLGAAVFPSQNPGLADASYAGMAVAAAVLFFTSLVLHELGHALIARREGMAIEGITLWVFGGVARFKGMFPSAGAEFRIAIAGPLVSLALGAAFTTVAALVPLPQPVDGVVAWLGRMNLVLLAFNMLPALPLDGGRVLRSALWRYTGDFVRSTRLAGALGRAFGVAMIVLGLASAFTVGAAGGLWLALIGWFLTAASAAEARHFAYPVLSDGGLAGLVTFRLVAAVPRQRWDQHRVADAMIPLADALVVEADEPLGAAAVELAQSPERRALVTDQGELAGLLSITDVSRLLELKRLGAGPALRAR